VTVPEKDPPEVVARIKDGMERVTWIARQMAHATGNWSPPKTLESYGHEALLLAARTFDPARHGSFRHFADKRIRWAMLDGLRHNEGDMPFRAYKRHKAVAKAEEFKQSLAEENEGVTYDTQEAADRALSDYLAGMATVIGTIAVEAGEEPESEELDPEQALAQAELRRTLHEIIAELSPPKPMLIKRRIFEEATLTEAAKEIGVDVSWAHRLLAQAVEDIAAALRRRGIRGP
jgi:RNA polymerase sigma factor for flagellar operon FliA